LDLTAGQQTFKLLYLRISGCDYPLQDLNEMIAAGLSIDSTNITPIRLQDRDTYVGMSLDCREFISMKDLVDFTNWAFGPAGFPNLVLLVYGDFSHCGRFGWTNLLFCREPSLDNTATLTEKVVWSLLFRIMSHQDEYLWDLIEGVKC
jgi:hypothetical protein